MGRWVPRGVVGWMTGAVEKSRLETAEKGGSVESSTEWEKVDDNDDKYVYQKDR